MRVNLKGINQITRRLADGSSVTYYYAWKSGSRLPGKPGDPEFIATFNEAVAKKVQEPKGTLQAVLNAYQTSPNISDLAPHLWLAFLLAVWTGQRQGDLLRLTWTAFDGNNIRLKQSKAGRRVNIPVGAN